jgi:hypothetical protein
LELPFHFGAALELLLETWCFLIVALIVSAGLSEGGVNGNRVGAFVVSDSKSSVVLGINEVSESDSSLGRGVGFVIGRLIC